jgi:hypothetical protein
MSRKPRDPQVDLIRRYARILRSAPAEALRAQSAPAPERGAQIVPPRGRFAAARERAADARRASPAR